MKEIIELPNDFLNYVKDKASHLSNASLNLFEYILVPRDSYVEITPEMHPQITDKMISYTIQNILGHKVSSNTKYTITNNNALKNKLIYSVNGNEFK